MALDADQLFVPGNGHLYVGNVGSTAPDDADTALAAAFAELGYTTDSGANLSPTMSVNVIRGWQSFYPLRRIVTERDLAVALTLLQWNADTLALYFGGATVEGSGSAFTISPPDPSLLDTRAFVLDGEDGERIYRLWLPVGMVTEAGEVTWQRSDAAGLPITIAPVTSGSAEPWQLFVADAEFAAT